MIFMQNIFDCILERRSFSFVKCLRQYIKNYPSFSLYNSATVITDLHLKYVVGDDFKENSQMPGVLLLSCRNCFKNIPSTLIF